MENMDFLPPASFSRARLARPIAVTSWRLGTWGIVEPAGGGAKMTSSLRNKEMLFTVVKVTKQTQQL